MKYVRFRFVSTMLWGVFLTGQALAANTATLLIEAFSANGGSLSISDFAKQTTYVASPKWSMSQNYGVFPMGKLPATAHVGGALSPLTQGSRQFVSLTIPSNQSVYFTCLWQADGIGTVYMRADNAGQGYTLADNQTKELQLPYEFALSEYAVASNLASGNPTAISAASTGRLQQAANLVSAATSAPDNAARAVVAYQALAVIMLLKEQLTLEISNAAIAQTNHRTDFTLNYEGFGSWTDSHFVAQYEQARAAGFGSVYTVVDWNVVSPTPGVYNFSSLDYQIDKAISLGFGVSLGINQSLGSMPEWVQNLPFEDMKARFYENALVVVQRYKDKIASIYPHTEPELSTKGRTLVQIADLTRQSFAGARAAAPTKAFGIYMSAAAYVGYQLNPVPNGEYFSSMDVLNYLIHNGMTPDFLGLEMQYATVFAPVDLQRQSEILQAYADTFRLPVYIGETGYSTRSDNYGISAQFFWREGLTEQAQAQWADGLLRIGYSNASVKGLYWVHVDPDNADYNSDFLTSLVGVSLFRADGTPKKAYTVFQSFATQYISSSSSGEKRTMVEFYNSALDYYFISSRPGDIALIDSLAGWTRTGNSFNVYSSPPAGALGLSRYYFDQVARSNSRGSHFYTVVAAEKAALANLNPTNAQAPRLPFNEGIDSFAFAPASEGASGGCASGQTPVYRLFRGQAKFPDNPNHRFTANLALYTSFVGLGWDGEGVKFCVTN
ncbi:MAG: beta-galactosidase [Casimicrobium sp.]